MKKIRIVLRLIIFVVIFSNARGQENIDTEGPIQGGFRHDTTARLLICKYNQATGEYNAYFWKSQSHNIAVIDIYSVVGWVYTYYVGKCRSADSDSYFYYFPFPRGIYFIKVGEHIKALSLIPGDKIEIMFYN